jgi:PAS domain S-box-containing protein
MLSLRLHAKFLVYVLGSLILLLAIVFSAVIYRESELLRQKAEDKQQLLVSTIYSSLKQNMMQGTPRSTVKLMNGLIGSYGLLRLEVLKKDGSRAFGTAGEKLSDARLARVFESGQELSYEEAGAQPAHTIFYPLRNEQACGKCHAGENPVLGVLIVSLSEDDAVRETAATTRRLTLFFGGLILVLGLALYALVRRVLLQPLAVLHEGAKRIGSGDLAHRIPVKTGDEIEDLAASLNLMASRLEESYAGLELRVQERTSEVAGKARRLYEYSRDLAAISRLSTKVFNAEQPLDAMLDLFMRTVRRGLGYQQGLLCLVDRAEARIVVKKDTGLGTFLSITDLPLTGSEPFADLVRTGKEYFIEDISNHSVFSRYCLPACDGMQLSLFVVPILTGAHNKRCWQAKNCIQAECPAYRRENEKCWMLAGTHCGNLLVESFNDKLAYCMSCDVFPVLGVLIVAVPAGRSFRAHHASVLRVLAAEIGAALENHRLHDDNKKLVRQLLELYRVIADSLAELSLDRALEAFTESALKFPGLDACHFWLLSPDRRELVHRAGGNIDQKEVAGSLRRLPADRGVMGRVLARNQIVVEYDLPNNDPTDLGKMAAAQGLPALLALPLKTEHGPIGVFSIHKRGATPFFENEIASFMMIANHAAMAINMCLLSEELKQQNRELARNTTLMGGILSSMSSGVLLLDRSGIVQLVNRAGAALLGLRADQLIGKRLTDLLPDAGTFLTTPPGPHQEADIRKQDGSFIPIGFTSTLYQDPAGSTEGILIMFRDMTEVRALQQAVLTKERFAAMGQLVAGVAHEIRNPLFGISSIGQIFERELTDERHLELVRALLSESKRMKQLVEDLLVYGRPAKLQYKKCNLRELWDEVIGLHREEIGHKGIALKGDFAFHPLYAYLDGHQVRQVLHNLFRNAIDATPAGGEIRLRLLLEDNFIIFKISDSGEGIPAEDRDRVFDLFYSTKPKGSGLGLPISKKIIEDHGGKITLDSRQGEAPGESRGTTVTVKLPYCGAELPGALAGNR